VLDSRFAVVVASSALVVGGFVAVLSAVDRRASLARAHRRAEAGHRGPGALYGEWVWTGVEENGRARLSITEADMVRRVGPRGWPGCPDGVVCTRHGIRVLSVGAGGAARWITNVVTSSDFEAVGRVRWVSPGLGVFAVAHRFSCAHPDQNRRVREERVLRYRREGDQLYVGIDDEADLLPLPSVERAGEPRRWMVFRHVTAATLWARYLLRLCQPTVDSACDDACFDPVGAP